MSTVNTSPVMTLKQSKMAQPNFRYLILNLANIDASSSENLVKGWELWNCWVKPFHGIIRFLSTLDHQVFTR